MLAADRGGRECCFGGYGASVVASLARRLRAGASLGRLGGGSQLAAASFAAHARSGRAGADLRGASAHESRSGSVGWPVGSGALDDLEGAAPSRPLATAARATPDVPAF